MLEVVTWVRGVVPVLLALLQLASRKLDSKPSLKTVLVPLGKLTVGYSEIRGLKPMTPEGESARNHTTDEDEISGIQV